MSEFPKTEEEPNESLRERWLRTRVPPITEEAKRPISLKELEEILDTTVKYDSTNKVITFLMMLLTYTDNDQMNLGYNAESSTGKSYIPEELALYFPKEDVRELAYTTPTAFFHEQGDIVGTGDFIETENGKFIEMKKKVIDMEKKIVVFIDQPHDKVLQRLRPLLSHDRKRLMHKITDRARRSSGLQTRSIEIVGYPTVVFCSTKFSLDEQERTRLLLLSPEVVPEKIEAAIKLLAEKLANRELFREWLEEHSGRSFLMTRIKNIKNASIKEVIINKDLQEQIFHRFISEHEHLIPRHMRDFPRLIGFIKAHALLNIHTREKYNNMLMVSDEDVDAGYKLYSAVSDSNELGIPPEVFTFYNKVFKPLAEMNGYTTKRDLLKKYFQTHHRLLGRKRLKAMTEILLETGLIIEDIHPDDRRKLIYVLPHTSEDIVEEDDSKPDDIPIGIRNRLIKLPEVIRDLSKTNVEGDWVDDSVLREWLENHWKCSYLEAEKLLRTATRDGVIYNPNINTWAVT